MRSSPILLAVALGGCPDPGARLLERDPRSPHAMDAMVALAEASAVTHGALARGDLHEARTRAGRLASGLEALPGGDVGDVVGLRLALTEVARAASVAEAAAGMGQVAQRCLDCHTHLRISVADRRPSSGAGHGASADGLWSAVVSPAPDALDRALHLVEVDPLSVSLRELARGVRTSPARRRGEAYGRLLAGCAGCHLDDSEPRGDAGPTPDLRVEMRQHFVDAVDLEIAVMKGDVDGFRAAARALAAPAEPGPLAERAGELQRVAARAESALTLDEMARATAELELACRSCHLETGGGPFARIPPPPSEPHM